MNRLYVIESTPTLTGAKADHGSPMRASDIEGFARETLPPQSAQRGGQAGAANPNVAKWVQPSPRICRRTGARSVVMAGEYQPAAVHVLAHAMNQTLGNVGTTVTYGGADRSAAVATAASLDELARRWTPARSRCSSSSAATRSTRHPRDLKFAEKLAKVGLVVYHGLYTDETA